MQAQQRIPLIRKQDLFVLAGHLLGGLVVSLTPQTVGRHFFRYRRKSYFLYRKSRIAATAEVMRAVLERDLPEAVFEELARQHYEMVLEDQWLRFSLLFRGTCHVDIETVGLEHVRPTAGGAEAQNHFGAVFWSTSFCGSLLPKVALYRAGMPFVMLSTMDHGAPSPLSRFGEQVVGPLARIAEDRFLASRVLIPRVESVSYMRLLKSTIEGGGSICVAGERDLGRQRFPAMILGRQMLFPTGAPALALSHNVPLIPLFVERIGTFRYRAAIGEPVQADRTSKQRFLAEAILDYARRIERHLLRAPADWAWRGSRVTRWARLTSPRLE
jgi:hypothetical protein